MSCRVFFTPPLVIIPNDIINILDIVILVNIVLGLNATTPCTDLTGDGNTDILDIVTMLQIIINAQEVSDYQMWVSDLNQDGFIDVLDVIIIVNLIIL